MKKLLNIIVAIFIASSFSGCEKDDICASTTPTTPRLVISFFDKDNPDVAKNLSNLKAVATGETNGVIFNESTTATDITKYLTSTNKISLPLRLNGETTEYALILNADNTTIPQNSDTVSFNYTTRQIYVSRACGYKVNFRLNAENAISRPDDGSEWINNITVETPNIESENETHIKIYF